MIINIHCNRVLLTLLRLWSFSQQHSFVARRYEITQLQSYTTQQQILEVWNNHYSAFVQPVPEEHELTLILMDVAYYDVNVKC